MVSQLDVAEGRDIVARWCALAERRLEYLTEMFETGRWRRYHSERAFLENIREAKAAVLAWRDLLSREASNDNRAIDMSWLGGQKTSMSSAEVWCDPVRLAKAAEIVREIQNLIVAKDKSASVTDTVSTSPAKVGATAIVPDLTAIAARYPLLHNAL